MATAAQPAPREVSRPSRLLTFSELHRAMFELGTLPLASPLLYSAPRGDGHPVLVLPGFMTSDRSTRILRRYLRRLGYDVHRWELGRNLGPRAVGENGELLHERLHEIMDNCSGQKVSLVGWSLGGAMARQLGQRFPDTVRQVITLGSPLQGSPRSTTVWRVYEAATGEKVTSDKVREQMAEIAAPPPVPTTAIFSKGDGVVPWQNCCVAEGEQSENVEVYGSHCGLGVNGTVLYVVADRLAQPEGEWSKFDNSGLRRLIYPSGAMH
ncbi:alpha/beta hydrolase [uncultured Parasphingopyxis sp.]|uniref:esterase/lipase family protein n=1 Tax=uncultured Parasphingopyxis sp. TaxID=1547918 RepID=UPI00260A604B|nr:alpha/beta hydrolase [uncultured Parasphingopyxis sp.]